MTSGGRLTLVLPVDLDGTKHETERCQYDENGRKTRVVFLPAPETSGTACSTGSCGTMYGVEGTNVLYSAPGATTSTTIYDEHERPSEASFYDANNALVSRVEFSRDQDGRVLSERMELAGPGGLLAPAFDGNWTERIVSQRLEPNTDERPSNIERRTITYYAE